MHNVTKRNRQSHYTHIWSEDISLVEYWISLDSNSSTVKNHYVLNEWDLEWNLVRFTRYSLQKKWSLTSIPNPGSENRVNLFIQYDMKLSHQLSHHVSKINDRNLKRIKIRFIGKFERPGFHVCEAMSIHQRVYQIKKRSVLLRLYKYIFSHLQWTFMRTTISTILMLDVLPHLHMPKPFNPHHMALSVS